MIKNIVESLDTHKLIKKLIASKLTPQQSETIVDVMQSVRTISFQDLVHKKDLESQILKLEISLIIKLGSLISVSMATLAALTKII